MAENQPPSHFIVTQVLPSKPVVPKQRYTLKEGSNLTHFTYPRLMAVPAVRLGSAILMVAMGPWLSRRHPP